MKKTVAVILLHFFFMVFIISISLAASTAYRETISHPYPLPLTNSTPTVSVGETAPDFSLPSISGARVTLSQFRGSKNVVLSFVPAAWTPICSDQWPGYGIIQDIFIQNNATLIGISVDNIPTLHAWTKQMGSIWFLVCADFYPHGKVAGEYGVLRPDGMAERAIFVIDKEGRMRFARVYDINTRPPLEDIVAVLQAIR
ncbi:MAG: peroxiredoxin [Deltaproteobacteria bacterium]|nr:peroxiredoxin [Deltaproteobacteria bacterium]